MKKISIFTLCSLLITTLIADSWSYPSKNLVVKSKNNIFQFTAILPDDKSSEFELENSDHHKRGDQSIEDCVGVLEKIDGSATEILWRNTMVNKVTPLEVIVTEDGKRVITFDNWFAVGTDPIVIYDEKGSLLKRYTLKSLGLMEFTRGRQVDGHGWTSRGLISRSTSSIHWRKNALTFLDSNQKRLFIRFYWGHLLTVDLIHGEILENFDDLDFVEHYTVSRVKELLYSDSGFDRRKGALLATSIQIAEVGDRLKELLGDFEFHESYSEKEGSYKNYYVREAAFNTLKEHGMDIPDIILREKFGANDKPKFGKIWHSK